MTPTEQDDELRDAIYDIAECNVQDTDTGEMMYAILPQKIIDLITADRKRVALEARIDELQQLVDDNSWQPIVPGYNVSRLERRIIELKHRLLKEQTNDETL